MTAKKATTEERVTVPRSAVSKLVIALASVRFDCARPKAKQRCGRCPECRLELAFTDFRMAVGDTPPPLCDCGKTLGIHRRGYVPKNKRGERCRFADAPRPGSSRTRSRVKKKTTRRKR